MVSAMKRRELSKLDFEEIDKALELVVEHFRLTGKNVAMFHARTLRNEFKDAHTGWLWFEDE